MNTVHDLGGLEPNPRRKKVPAGLAQHSLLPAGGAGYALGPASRVRNSPRSSTTSPDGPNTRKAVLSPPSHNAIRSSSPGKTGLLKRPLIDAKRAGSDPASSPSRHRPTTP